MKNKIANVVTGTVNKCGFGLRKYSPEILVVSGVVGTIVSAVMACKATTKISAVLEEHKETMDAIHTYSENGVADENLEYTQEDAKKDTTITYIQTGIKLAKLYAPAVGLGILSIGSILTSNNILRKRNAALAAAYAAIDRSFKEYRSRVVERFGEEVDHQLRCNIKAVEIEEKITDEKGKEKKVKKTIDVADPNAGSEFLKYFTRRNAYWDNNEDYLEMFFRAQQQWANDKLRADKKLTLNQVYESLGFEATKAGMVCGWIYNANNPVGDNYVEFNIHKVRVPLEDGTGYDDAYSIDFNVDGDIYSRL